MSFKGIYQILHTPFDERGAIDWTSLERQIDFALGAGAHGLVLPAMASEFFSLSDQERLDLTEAASQKIDGHVPLVVGVQGVSLPVALNFAGHASELGCNGLMAMPPYLRKPSRAVIVEYYRALAGFDLPVIVQNAPPPVGTPLEPAVLAELAGSEPNIAYVKEETPPILQRISRTLEVAGNVLDGVFGGANGLYLTDELRRGACGNMPAGGLIDLQVKVYDLWNAGRREEAGALHRRLLPLLSHASVYGVTFHKFLLWKRGVLAHPTARDPQAIALDGYDEETIAALWRDVADEALDGYAYQA